METLPCGLRRWTHAERRAHKAAQKKLALEVLQRGRGACEKRKASRRFKQDAFWELDPALAHLADGIHGPRRLVKLVEEMTTDSEGRKFLKIVTRRVSPVMTNIAPARKTAWRYMEGRAEIERESQDKHDPPMPRMTWKPHEPNKYV